MKFKNLDNTPIFEIFMRKYELAVNNLFPELCGLEIETRSLTQVEEEGLSSDDVNNSPFCCDLKKMQILRSNKECTNCGLKEDEEIALIAHEIGHFIIAQKGTSALNGNEEEWADSYAAKIVGNDSLKNALQKIYDSPSDTTNDDMNECFGYRTSKDIKSKILIRIKLI